MQINVTQSLTQGLPSAIIRSYHKGTEFITLCLNPKETAPPADVQTDTYEDARLFYTYTSISIVNDAQHLTLQEIIAVAIGESVELSPSDLAVISETYGITTYDALVPVIIRAIYSADDEFAIQRKAILGDMDEFDTYNQYVDSCKKLAKMTFPDTENE